MIGNWCTADYPKAHDALIINPDSTFISYNCEQTELTYGSYSIESDTIYFHVDSSQYNHHFSPHIIAFHLINDSLIFLWRSEKDGSNIWKPSYDPKSHFVHKKSNCSKLNKDELKILEID